VKGVAAMSDVCEGTLLYAKPEKNRLCDIPSGHSPDQRILIT